MTSELKDMLSKVDTLSQEDLLALQKHISEKLDKKDNKVDLSKIGYRLSPEKMREQLLQVFTPEELAAADEYDIDEPLNLPKTLTEYISEDREDRF